MLVTFASAWCIDLVDNLFLCDLLRFFFFVFFLQTVDNLSFLQSAMSD